MLDIEALGREIASRFQPRQVLLFGSHAKGTATEHSDVDLLVVLPSETRPVHKAAEIRLALRRDIPIDILVKTPGTIQQRLAMGDCFIEEVVREGKKLYEAPDP